MPLERFAPNVRARASESSAVIPAWKWPFSVRNGTASWASGKYGQ